MHDRLKNKTGEPKTMNKGSLLTNRFCFASALALWFALIVLPQVAAQTPANIGSQRVLFVDQWLIESMSDVTLKLHEPVRKEEVFRYDAAWEGFQSAYVSVMQDDSVYRMYYRAGGDLSREYTCMALSNDGIHWTRPSLGLFSFGGSTNNNIIWTGEKKAYWESHNFAPFKDLNPAAIPSQKYKAVTLSRRDYDGVTRKVLMGFVSPDAVHWSRIQEDPIMIEGGFDSLNVAFWDTVKSTYVCYSRTAIDGKRNVQLSTSPDFINWGSPTVLDYGTAPIEQFYTNGIIQFPREPHLYIGLPMRFVPERTTVGADDRVVDGLSDGVFMSSQDGLHWNRPFMEAYIRPGLIPENWGSAHGNQTAAWGILLTSPEEISVYWLEQYDYMNAPPQPPVLRRGTVRMDGFASVHATYAGGEFVTRPFTFQGDRLFINYATSAVGSVKVEIQDTNGEPVPGYDLASAKEIYGDELDRVVEWNDNPNVGALAGTPIKLRFVMMDADLYSIQFRSSEKSTLMGVY
jgi:hypothetical protein